MSFDHDPQVLTRAAFRLAAQFEGVFAAETIERLLHESYDLLAATSKITTYLPLLAERFATERLRALARNQGAIVSDRPEILVVCTHNAGRSIAARVLLDHHGAGRVVVRSAGSAPGDEINPAVAEILTERGLDVSKEFPKPLTDEAARSADVIITMGCGDACPVFPRQALPRLGPHRPGGQVRRGSAPDRRRHRPAHPGPAHRALRRADPAHGARLIPPGSEC